jgi:Ctr copper transporter family
MGTRCCWSSRIVAWTMVALCWCWGCGIVVPLVVATTKWPPLEPASGVVSTLQQDANAVDHTLTTTMASNVHERAMLDPDPFMAEEKDDFEIMDQPEHMDRDSQSHPAAAAAASKNNSSFCQNDGMNMAMYMDGWHWSTTSSSSLDCLSYLVPSWRLETRWKFNGALLYTFGLAVLLSAVSSVRVGVVVAVSTSTVTSNARPTLHNGANHGRALLLLLFLYAIQALVGYALMLVVMTYSIELLLAVIAGLVTGHIVWAAAALPEHDIEYSNDNEDVDLSQDDVHVERQSLLGPAGEFDGSVEGTLGTAGGTLLFRRR